MEWWALDTGDTPHKGSCDPPPPEDGGPGLGPINDCLKVAELKYNLNVSDCAQLDTGEQQNV